MTFFPPAVYGAALRLELNYWLFGERVPLLSIQRLQSLSLWFRRPHQKQKFGKHSYLKLTHCFSPFSMDITLPRQRGRVILILTRTQIKYPPSSSTTLVDFCTSPTMSQIPSVTFVFMKHTGILWTCTQKSAFVNTRSRTKTSVSYRCNITKYLSKLQGWLWRTRSTSFRLSKMKRTLWSFWFWILKPFVDLHSCLKVLARISMFKKRGVRNCAAMMNSPDRWSFWRTNPVFSLSDSEKLLHLYARSSMANRM